MVFTLKHYILFSLFCSPIFLFYANSFSQESEIPFHCNLEIVHNTNIKIDSLDFEQVELFLNTFDSTCKNNAEFHEYSNEVLFKVLNTQTFLLVKVLSTCKSINLPLILSEIENPVIEFDLNPIYMKLNEITGSSTTINLLKKCVRIAAANSNQILKE